MKVRSYLATLVTAVMVPVVVFSALAVKAMIESEREAVQQSMRELARASAMAMDQDLVYAAATVRTLATSNRLANEDFPAFYSQTKAAGGGRAVHGALLDQDGQQIFNTIVPFGTAIDTPDAKVRERVASVVEGGQLQVSELMRGRVSGQYVIAVEQPVRALSGKHYLIDQWIFASHLQSLLPTKNVPDSWLIAVFDRKGTTIARNRSHEQYVGTQPRSELRNAMRRDEAESVITISREGKRVYTVLARSHMTGWVVAVGVPSDEIDRTAVRAVTLTAAGLLLAVMLAVVGALVLGRRLVHAIEAVDRSARLMGTGQVPPLQELHVHEVTQLQHSLNRVGQQLHEVEADRLAHLVQAQDAQRLAESQSRAKDEFLAMLGHELRNPLAAITSAVALLDMLPDGAPGALRAREVIARQSRQLNSLVDELLDAQRILTGKIKLRLAVVDMRAALDECASAHQAQLAQARHELVIESRPAWVRADPTRLQQIIANLLDNAIKYTPSGGRITLDLRTEGGMAVLKVTDNGVGMEAELQERIFALFVQGESSQRQAGGLGIGLAVVRALAEQQGGSVLAYSAGAGQGSCFTVTLPLVDAHAMVEPTPAPAQARSADTPRRTVLLVEDNDDVRHMLASLLEASGVAVVTAANGTDGIAAVAIHSVDLGLIDIDLPDMTGYDVARSILLQRPIPMIALTGFGQARDRRQASEAGFDMHLTKPVKIEDLVAAIETVLARPRKAP